MVLMTKQLATVTPQSIMEATALDEFDTVSMMVGVLRSDFSLSLLTEWMELEMPEISYLGYIETEIDNLASFMRMKDESEMMDVDTHLAMVTFLQELAKIKAQS